jgi:peptidoglycan hydrolase-like protein with peptidoglycan-binding domain
VEPPVEPPPIVARVGRARRGTIAAVAALLVGAVALIAVIVSGGGSSDEGPGARPAVAERPAAPVSQAPAPTAAELRRERTRDRIASMGDRLLGRGATGPDVKALQKLIGVPQTGSYDDATAAAVSEFQAANGLHVDGNAGDETKRLLARGAR